MPPHPLTNFEIQIYYQNKPKFYFIFSKSNLPKIEDETYVTNLDKSQFVEINLVAIYVENGVVVYFDYFGLEHILKNI